MAFRINQRAVDAAQQVLAAHNEIYGLEKSNGDKVDVWHLVASLLEFCDARGLEFDLVLEDVREAFKRGEL